MHKSSPFLISKIQKFSGPPQTPPPVGRGTHPSAPSRHPLPIPHPLGAFAFGASILAPSALDLGAFGASILPPVQ